MTTDWKQWLPKQHPYEPADWDEEIVWAFRSFVAGKANEAQQLTVWRYVQYLTDTGEFDGLSFRAGGADAERETAFAEGKRFVGLQLRKLLGSAILEAIDRQKNLPTPRRGKR